MKFSIVALASLCATLSGTVMAAPAAIPEADMAGKLVARKLPFTHLEWCNMNQYFNKGVPCGNTCTSLKDTGYSLQFTCGERYDIWNEDGGLFIAGGDGTRLGTCDRHGDSWQCHE